jgi:anti-sigma B factor antagonist
VACPPCGPAETTGAGLSRPPRTTREQILHSSSYLVITAEPDESRPVLRLRGEVDLCNKDAVRQAIHAVMERGAQTLVIDMSELGFIDCAGMRVLIRAREQLAEGHGQLVLARSRPAVRRLISLLGLDGQ